MLNRRNTFKIFQVVVLATICFSVSVLAQQEELLTEEGVPTDGVQVSPSRFNWNLKPGEEQVGFINLKNYSKSKVFEVHVQVEDFYVTDDSTEAKFFVPDENHPLYAYDVINWIEIDGLIEIQPGESKDVLFKVIVPKETPTGGYYGGVFFRSLVKSFSHDFDSENSANLRVNQRVGSLLIIAVKGDEPIQRSGELSSFLTSEKIYFKSPVSFIAKIKNTGNIHYQTIGNIEVYKFGKKVDDLGLLSRILYPNKTRIYEREWNFDGWSYGFYKAKIELISEDGQIRTTGVVNFWIVPWKTTVVIGSLIALIWIIINIFTSKFEITLKKSNQKQKTIQKTTKGFIQKENQLKKAKKIEQSQFEKKIINHPNKNSSGVVDLRQKK